MCSLGDQGKQDFHIESFRQSQGHTMGHTMGALQTGHAGGAGLSKAALPPVDGALYARALSALSGLSLFLF